MDMKEMMAGDAKAAAENVDGEDLTMLGIKALGIEEKIAESEATTKALKKELEQIMRHAIPQALTIAGIGEFGFAHDGGTARIMAETKVVGSLRYAPDEDEAVEYLEASGFTGGVKSVVTIDFTEDERDQASVMVGEAENIVGKHATLTRSIHPQTLISFGRDYIKTHPEFDLEKIGLKMIPMSKFSKRR